MINKQYQINRYQNVENKIIMTEFHLEQYVVILYSYLTVYR